MISVLKHGAKGDGINDDTEAFRRALMQEGEVHVPDGMYVITGDLPVSRLCRGISSDKGGGIILARHPEWGYDIGRYFRSANVAPSTTSYRLKRAAIEWAIRVCAKVGRVPDWLHTKREQVLSIHHFEVARLTVVGVEPVKPPGVSFGGICPDAWDKRMCFDVIFNSFMSNEWWAKRTGIKTGEDQAPREALARKIYDAFDARFRDEYVGSFDALDFTATLDGSFSFLVIADIMQEVQADKTACFSNLENLKPERE
jgi:hypothetical protein